MSYLFLCETADFLKTNQFRPHPRGNQMRFGLNGFGCDSVILFEEQLWKFLYFNKNGIPIYINARREQRQIHLKDDTCATRMEAIEWFKVFKWDLND